MRRSCDGLAWPAVACALLLTCVRASAAAPRSGICQSMDVRSSVRDFEKLRGCRVIEGQLSVVLLDRYGPNQLANWTFPELREVTGYIKIYRLKGIRNLGDLFPNLTVIRGMQLFKDYSLIIFDNEDCEMLGLRSLSVIERGAVRIQNNDKLCYANTIDWNRIILDGSAENNMIRSNYDLRLCGLCPNAQSRTQDHRKSKQCPSEPTTNRLLCWDDKNCQKVCPTACADRGCLDNGKCCHETCLGGCDGPSANDCYVCRDFSLMNGADRICTKKCPANMYEVFRRCVTEQECRSMPSPATSKVNPNPPTIKAYKIFNGTCVWTCPNKYMEAGTKSDATCVPCSEKGCQKECSAIKIASVADAEKLRGCTHITGLLEISIRATGGNTMAILEASLGEIREISGSLKVTRSNPLVSLMFLKNLESIIANQDVKNGHALHIFNNANLELLWDWRNHKPIKVEGALYIHFNPKLCYTQIEPLMKSMKKNFTAMEVSDDNNGDQASCNQKTINLKVQTLHKSFVILAWDMYCLPDSRNLLGYSIFYIPTQKEVTLYGQRDACSDLWSVLDVTLDEMKRNNSFDRDSEIEELKNPCKNVQPVFYPVTQLTPYTRYAAYVKTFTTLQDRNGAQSPIIYFTTLPGRPSPPQAVTVEPRSPHNVSIKWSPPSMPNGTIIKYHVEIQANSYNRDKIVSGYNNYCGNPSALANLIAGPGEDVPEKQEEKSTGDVKNGSCACKEDSVSSTRFSSQVEEERWESIQFENELQNEVYIKQDRNYSRKENSRQRMRRSINQGLNSMLVILSKNNQPTFQMNVTNSTEDGYVKSQYYVLDGLTRSLTVTNMRHFTWYTVNVWACRARQDNETYSAYEETWCSERSYYTFRTLEEHDADVVTNVHAETLPSNKSLPEVNVTWDPPVNPNGFVVAYNVHYSRIEDSSQTQDVGLQSCITASDCKGNSTCTTMLRNLLPGKYSVKVTPVTVSGAGVVSAQALVEVPAVDSGNEWIWGVVGGCVIMILMLGGGIWYARRGFLPPAEANKLFASVNPEYVSTVYVPDEWEVPRSSIEFIRELGQGSFGMVYEGIAKNIEKGKPETRCAVKTVNEHATDRERIEFLNEASVMKAFDTFHVVRLLGVVSRGQPTLVVMELMEQGDLKTYLRSHRPDSESSLPKKDASNNPPTLQNILQMAIEIADGMAYLSAKKFVHRDLAARNCMVAGDLTVKVGDFGMTRDIYETDYYRKGTKGLLPVRWMSPESLKDGVFSSNSDIWSYGVVLWEMATLAMQPYQGLSNEQVVRYVVEGGVMERPEHCPDRLYELMRACWAHRPSARPSFLQMVADLAPSSQPHFRHRSFFHSPHGQEMYALQKAPTDEEQEIPEVNVGAVATGSGSNLFGVSGRLSSWVRELSSLRSRGSHDAATEPLQPQPQPQPRVRDLPLKGGPNGVIREPAPASTGC